MERMTQWLLIHLFGYSLYLLDCTGALGHSALELAEYHCSDFMNNTLNDEAMQFVYYFNNEFIRLFSHSFQHERLFPSDSINVDVIKESFTTRTNNWLEHEQWWLMICASLIFGSAAFTIFYLLYRCFVCCCGQSKKPLSADRKHDNCKRALLHVVFSVFVIVNIFAAAVLILCSQYATHSVDQLPDRISSCVGDLAIYKTNTQRQVDQLLTDDFNEHSQGLLNAFNKTGKDVVKYFKRGISVDVFDDLVAQEQRAHQLRDNDIPRLQQLIKEAQNLQSVYSNNLSKMKDEYGRLLENCQNEFKSACSIVARAVALLEVKSPTLEKLEVPIELDNLVEKTVQMNFQHELESVERYFVKLENKIQEFVNTKQEDAKTRVKEAFDTVAAVKNDLNKDINDFNFNELRDYADGLKEKSKQFGLYIQYGWYASLIIGGVFAFISLCFLFGLIYGCCGKRSSYYDEDCCVRSTGSKFYCCGISLALMFMLVFAIITSVMLLFGANFTNLVCDPWKHPVARQDVVSFVDRFFFRDLLTRFGGNENGGELTLSQLITKCNEGQTFYTIFGMDKKLKLSRGFADDLEQFLGAMYLPNDFVVKISQDLRDASLSASDNVYKSAQAFEGFAFPPIEGTNELLSESRRFDLETLNQQVRGRLGTKPYVGTPIVNVLDLLKEFAPKGQKLTTKVVELGDLLKQVNSQIEQLNRKPESSRVNLAFNNLIEEKSDTRNAVFLNATREHMLAMNRSIMAFEEHVRTSMSTRITSCEPIRRLLNQSHSAVCVHLIDAFNAIWMTMLISLLLFVPMIMIATSLSRLYNNVQAYKYAIQEPNSESAFTTDDYAMHDARKFSVSSPYATNYGYHENIYPPPYLNNPRYR